MSTTAVLGEPAFQFAEECDRGALRKENQDAVLHARVDLGDVLIVADGVGEYKGGTIASQMAVDTIYEYLAQQPLGCPPDRAIREAALLANSKILSVARAPESARLRMGSSVVVALLQHDSDGNRVWIGHVGNSRAYLFRAGRLHRLTIDHSAAQALLNRNLITPEEAKEHPDASVPTRNLGQQAEVEIDIEPHILAVDDTVLLCSRGVWSAVAEHEIERTATDTTLSLETAAFKLLESAALAGSHDNIGIEMARLAAPKTIIQPRRDGYIVLRIIIVLFLLSAAALATLVYLTFFKQY
jgi:serine/threonine protein phosphatase PrpC